MDEIRYFGSFYLETNYNLTDNPFTVSISNIHFMKNIRIPLFPTTASLHDSNKYNTLNNGNKYNNNNGHSIYISAGCIKLAHRKRKVVKCILVKLGVQM